LSRQPAPQLILTEALGQANVTLHLVTTPAQEKSPEAQLLSNVRGIIAEYERAKIMARTTRGRFGRVKAGHVRGGQRPLGYIQGKNPVDTVGADRVVLGTDWPADMRLD
jgi:site-specific DNA recombinase